MPDSTLALLTAKTPGAAALLYGAVSPYTPGLDRKVSMTAAGATLLEAANAAAQLTALGAATLGANTYTALQTITQASANAGILASTGYSLTGSDATSMVNLAGTWNTTGTPTAIKLNITNTASNASSLLMDLQVGGTSMFKFRRDSTLLIGDGTANPAYEVTSGGAFAGYAGIRVSQWGAGLLIKGNNSYLANFDGANSIQINYVPLGFATLLSSADLILSRDAAATLQMGANHATTATPQTLKAHDVTTGTGASLTLAGGKGSAAGGALILATSATNGAPVAGYTLAANGTGTFTGAQTIGGALALGTTPTAYATLTNTTAAAAGAQQVSPSMVWSGQGWKTNATAASQTVNYRAYVLPIQGAANPTSSWKLDYDNGTGSYLEALTFTPGASPILNLGDGAVGVKLSINYNNTSLDFSANYLQLTSGGQAFFRFANQYVGNPGVTVFGDASAALSISTVAATIARTNANSVTWFRDGTGVWQAGIDDATTATAQTIKAHDVTTGTGASLTLAGGKGSAAGGALILATSATNGAPVTALTIGADQSTTLAGPLSAIATTITSSSATALTVGQNGATNPALQVDASTGSSATGIKITSAAAGGGVTITATSSAASESLTLSSKGSANTKIDTSGAGYLTKSGVANISWAGADVRFDTVVSATASTVRYNFTGAADTSLTASTEAPSTYFNIGQTRQHATGALTLQRDFRITGSTHSFVGASTLTDAAAFSVDGPCIAGTNATITNSHGIYVPTRALTGTITNAYGLSVAAPSGATNNYAAQFDGKIIMTNLPTSSAGLPTGALWNNSGVLNVA